MKGKSSFSALSGDGEQRGVSELPRHIKECIFEKLPLMSIYRCRAVCKEWKSILSAHSFLSSLPSQNPWLLVYRKDYCMAYCFSTQKWRAISFSFLPIPVGNDLGVYMLNSTALGLVPIQENPTIRPLHLRENPKLYLCNPLLRIYSDIQIHETGNSVHIVQGRNGELYLVVTFGEDPLFFSFRIYHYCQDSWRIKFEFSEETGFDIYYHEMVECNGILFWTAEMPETIVGYSIQDDCIEPVRIAPLPDQLVEDEFEAVPCMVTYGSSILLVLTMENLVIWELFQDGEDKLLWKWKEFARMPSASLSRLFCGDGWMSECITVGDYLCISIEEDGVKCDKVVAYNLKEGFWLCLPHFERGKFCAMLSFEPKLIFPQFLPML